MSIPSTPAGTPPLASWGQAVTDALNAIGYQGFQPYAYPMGIDASAASTTQTNLVAVSASKAGILLIPIALRAPMLLQSITVRSSDTASARSCEMGLYRDTGSAILERVTGTDATLSFTPSAISDRTANVSAPGTPLLPGTYWLAIRNTSASQTFGVRRTTTYTELAGNLYGQDNVPNALALGSTLDTSGLTLTTGASQALVRLNGRVFGGSAAF